MTRRRKIAYIVAGIVLTPVVLFLLLVAALYIPAVQNWAVRHAAEYAFPGAAGRLKNTALLLITGELDTCISNDMLKTFHEAAAHNNQLPLCLQKRYSSKHGLMGVRVRISRDIADFILRTCK